MKNEQPHPNPALRTACGHSLATCHTDRCFRPDPGKQDASAIAGDAAAARRDLVRMGAYPPGTPAALQLATSALAHATNAMLALLDALLGSLEPPRIPGLPDGYELAVSQAGEGERRWRYELTVPSGGVIVPARYAWDYPETAMVAGIRAARELEDLAGATLAADLAVVPAHVCGETGYTTEANCPACKAEGSG